MDRGDNSDVHVPFLCHSSFSLHLPIPWMQIMDDDPKGKNSN